MSDIFLHWLKKEKELHADRGDRLALYHLCQNDAEIENLLSEAKKRNKERRMCKTNLGEVWPRNKLGNDENGFWWIDPRRLIRITNI
jgi:hypothetical protein